MLVSLVGARELDNSFRQEVANYFKCPVFQFKDLTDQIFESMSGIFGLNQFTSLKIQDRMKLAIRQNLTEITPSLYIDWMSNQLVEHIFRKADNSSKKLQGIILDVDTSREYRTLRTFLLNPKFNKHNKFVLIENEDVMHQDHNKDYNVYNEFEIDAVLSSEDEMIDRTVSGLLKKWHLD